MRLLILTAAVASVCGAQPAFAQRHSALPRNPVSTQRAGTLPRSPNNAQDRIALSTRNRPEEVAPSPAQLACAPLSGQVFDPNGEPLVGATLLVKNTQQVYVTDAKGQFVLTEPVYQNQVLSIEAAGYITRDVTLADCNLPRLVLEQVEGVRIKRSGKRAGQVTRLGDRSTTLK